MARRDGANGADTDGTNEIIAGVNAGTVATADKAKRPRNPDFTGVMLQLPNELHGKLAETAKSQDTSVTQLVKAMLANAYDYTLPASAKRTRVKKYGTDEERKEAAKEAAKNKRLATQAVFKAIEDGLLGDVNIQELVARMQAENAAKEAAANGTDTDVGDPDTSTTADANTGELVGATS